VRQEPFWANDPIAAPTRQQREPAPFWANDPAATPRPSVPQAGPDAPFQPELLPGDNGIYPSPPLAGATPPPAPLDTMSAEEAAANAKAFGNQGTRLDPIDLQTLPPEDIAYLNAGMYVRLPNGEVSRMMRDARPGAGGPGTQEIRPGLFIEENSDVPTDIAKSLPTGVVESLTGLAGMQGTIGQMIYGKQSLGQNMPGFGIVGPTGAQINQTIRNQIGYDYYQPQTVSGEYARTFGENLIGGLAPGGPLTRAASVAVPAFASEGAAQIAEGMGASPTAQTMARTIAGLGGGLAVGGVNAVRGGADISLRNAAQGVTPQQLQMAAALRDRAQAAGINMTNANALQQVTGGATGLGQLQRAVEGGSPLLQRYFAELPEQTRNAINAQLEQIGPLVEPSQLAGQAREAANRVLQNTRANINAQARPFYRAADDQVVSAEEYAALQEIPTYREAEAAFFGSPELSAGAGGPQSVSAINRVIQEMDTLARQADQGNMTVGANANLARVRGESAELAKGLVDLSSPSYAQARVIGAAGRQNELVPIQRGPIGSIARQDELQPDLGATTGVLFSDKPFRGEASETARALELMGEIDPSVGGPLVRQHLDRIAMEAQQDLVSGPNQFGGANFAVRAFGNPEQRETVMQALDVVNRPDPNMAFPPINANAVPPRGSDPMANLVEILMATGQRHQGGSQTAFIQDLQRQMRGGDVVQESWGSLLNPMRIPGRVAGAVDELTAQANKDTLADLLMGSSEDFNARLTRALNRPRGANRIRAGVAVTAGQED
jgi:hypothetical protein